jgi:Fibronectin type III domain
VRRGQSGQTFGLASRSGGGATRLTPWQIGVGLVVVVAVLGASIWFAVAGQPSQAVQTQPFGGSLVLNYQQGPVVMDLASGTASIELANVNRAVTAPGPSSVSAIPVSDGSLLLNSVNGTFNFLGQNNVLVAPTGGGVALSGSSGFHSAAGFAAGSDAYVVGDAASSATISLVNEEVVAQAARRTSAASTGGSSTVQPLGTATTDTPVDLGVGGSVTANGDFWSIADASPSQPSQRLIQYAPASRPGNPLTMIDRGSVAGVASLGVGAGPSGTQTVALATPGEIRVFPAAKGSAPVSLAVPDLGATTQIVPVSGAIGQVLFAYQASGRWSLLGADPATARLIGPVSLQGVPGGAVLRAPAFNRGSIYTVADTQSTQPRLLHIDPRSGLAAPLPGVPDYPLVSSRETPSSFSQTQVISVGPRVIINNPDSILGVVVFTDGSQPPKTFDKGTLASVDPAAPGGVALNAAPKTKKQSQPNQQQVQAAVDAQSRCLNTSETPHRPVITTPLVASTHTVTLSWSYQLLSNQDCEPTTYTVAASVVGDGQGPAQPEYVVQGQLTFTYPGLHPNVTYQFVVTAFIGQDQTASLPEEATTNPQGPDPPTAVTATDADGTGWTVSWTACSGSGCDANEPATQWTVTGQSCGSGAFIGTPPTVTVSGSTETATFRFADNPSLIGRPLQFEVQGTDILGHVGDPATSSGCADGWAIPVASDISLSASESQAGDFTDTATLTVAPVPGVSAAEAYGSLSTQYTFVVTNTADSSQIVNQVGNPGGGPIGSPTMTVTGLIPGVTYSASVTVTPVGHPSAATTVPAEPISGVTSSWPSMALVSSTAVLDPSADTGSLSATIAGAYGNVPAGQSEALQASGSVSCSGTVMPAFAGLPVAQGAGGTGIISGIPLSLVGNGGPGCVLNLTLSESGTNFHGGPTASTFALPPLGTQYDTPIVSAALQETAGCAFCVAVTASTPLEAGTSSLGGVWTTTVTSTDGVDPTDCAQVSQLAPSAGGSVSGLVDMSSCVQNFENVDGSPTTPVTVTFTVTVSWTYLGVLSGPVPTIGPPLSTGPVTPTATPTSTPPGP